MNKKIVIAISILTFFLGNVCFGAITGWPKVKSQAALVMDAHSGRVLYEKNGYSKRYIASLTKIMTAIVVIENCSLSETVEIKTGSAVIGGSTVGMKKGDKITIRALMHGMLMRSGNDCAVALAEHVGGSVEEFAIMMTEKAKSIGAKQSVFKNPHGLDVEGSGSSAYDIALITRYALNNKYINEMVNTNSIQVQFGKTIKTFSNTNRLLRTYGAADGVKTGFTNGANRCLAASGTNGDLRIISIVLGADTTDIRFDEGKELLDYALKNYELVDISKTMNWYVNIPVYKGTVENYEKYITEGKKIALTKEEEDKIYIKQMLLPVINAPMQKGYNLGTISMHIDDEVIYTTDIILDQDINKKTPLDYALYGFRNLFNLRVAWI